jgi:hypothetical protein
MDCGRGKNYLEYGLNARNELEDNSPKLRRYIVIIYRSNCKTSLTTL